MKKNSKKNNKRNVIVALLALCLITTAGTMAWLTSTSELKNTFTVGDIAPIDPEQPGPGENPDPIDPDDDTKLKDNLYEPSWENGSKIFPDAEIDKDPYVGIGPKSEDSYAYIFVKNDMDNVYFTLNADWVPVTGHAEEFAPTDAVDGTTYYHHGLFMYNGFLQGAEDANVWTNTPAFSTVIADSAATKADLESGTITVKSFLHQAKDGDGNLISTDITNVAAITAYDEFMATTTP